MSVRFYPIVASIMLLLRYHHRRMRMRIMCEIPRVSVTAHVLRSQSHSPSQSQPHIRQEYPLNLSILLSGGKENKRDSLSNGE